MIGIKQKINDLWSKGWYIIIPVCILALLGYLWLGRYARRETIFDRTVSIPKELVLNIAQIPPLCDEIAGLKKGFIDVKNGKLYYEEEGRGIPLVLINGGPGGTHHCFHPHFSQLKNIARVIYYDQRGTGNSSTDDTGKTYTIKQAVEDLESLRKALKIERWAVLGWSYGGLLAQCYALTYPEHVTGLILISSAYGHTNAKLKPGREHMFISQAERDAIRKIYHEESADALTLAQAVYNAHLAGDWKRQCYYKPRAEQFIRMALYEWKPAPGFRALICAEDDKINLDGKFNDFEVPTLLMEAKWDLTWDTDKAAFMRKSHPHAQFDLFEKSGHAIFTDEPKKFFAVLSKFLEKSAKTHVVYKPGKRLIWPKEPSEFSRKITMIRELTDPNEKEKQLRAFYQQTIKKNVTDASAWLELLKAFFGRKEHPEKKYANEALVTLHRYESLATPQELQPFGHCLTVTRGQLLDMLGKRKEAIKCYQEILRDFKGVCESCTQVDRKWLEEHIKTPFKGD